MAVKRALFFLLAMLGLGLSAAAQQRPLITEDPETIGAGRVLVEAGFDYGHDVDYPASGLTGNLLRLPLRKWSARTPIYRRRRWAGHTKWMAAK